MGTRIIGIGISNIGISVFVGTVNKCFLLVTEHEVTVRVHVGGLASVTSINKYAKIRSSQE